MEVGETWIFNIDGVDQLRVIRCINGETLLLADGSPWVLRLYYIGEAAPIRKVE